MTIYVVATPIGNLDDLSTRAANVLRAVDLVAAEDTRHSRRLLDAISSDVHITTMHEHSSEDEVEHLLEQAKTLDIALISDAGTPGISDPGYRLISRAHQRGLGVSPIPGPSAVTGFLSASGLPTDAFTFVGFLSSKGAARQKELKDSLARSETVVLYESPRRVESLLKSIDEYAPERPLVIGRELTKIHEELIAGTAAYVLKTLEERDSFRGEFVIGIRGSEEQEHELSEAIPWIDTMLDEELRTRTIAKVLSKQLGLSKSKLYQLVLERSGEK